MSCSKEYIDKYEEMESIKLENYDQTYHSASSIGMLFGFSTISKPLTTTKRTRFSSCTTNSGNLLLVSREVANSLLLNVQDPEEKPEEFSL